MKDLNRNIKETLLALKSKIKVRIYCLEKFKSISQKNGEILTFLRVEECFSHVKTCEDNGCKGHHVFHDHRGQTVKLCVCWYDKNDDIYVPFEIIENAPIIPNNLFELD